MNQPSAPDSTQWFSELLKSQQAALGPFAADQAFAPWMQAATAFTSWQQETMKAMTAFWPMSMAAAIPGFPGAVNVAADQGDRRFSAEAWTRNPGFDMLSKSYLTQAQGLRQALEAAPMDERTKAQWGFLLRQVVDALSPANCLLTNPEALQTAVDTGGRSLIEGARLFLEDFAKGRVSMTDETAFEVGKNVARSPGSVVFENEIFQLIQYAPSTEHVKRTPLLVVPPCINKFYILDLQPENSLVAYAASQGHTVFLVSWRNVDASLGHLTWDDYQQQGVMKAIEVAREIAGSDQVNALGFCIGGSLLATTLAVMAAKGEADKVASMTLLTTLLDFSDTGELGLMITPQSMALRESTIGKGGVLHGRELAHMFAALRANDLIWPYVVNGYLQGKAPPPFDLLYWNADDSNLPGPLACFFMRQGYLENKLRVPGAVKLCGVPLDLRQVKQPAFLYASREDHIVPWKSAYASTQLLGGPLTFVLGASGHIAGVINPPAKKKRSYWELPPVDADAAAPSPEAEVQLPLPADPEHWFKQAQQYPGSWWTAWSDWLALQGGDDEVPARAELGNATYPPIEPAPGRYVKAKAT
ncbi:PHA/PHB synthase family protein [Azohydromonas aeria]|uniref:PHA/PHB synthase family protein n=1 Tax=Azohydromonas aeria TaxID=2590212 RepID=UPI0012F7085F|nr:class I poly(R)-hydroxyalkanoic acid synthase [Azohydromonas aeria]